MSLQSEDTKLKGPVMVEYDGDAADPATVAAVPEIATARALQTVSVLASPKRSAFGRFAFWVFSSLFGLILSVTAWKFVTGLFASNSILGWVAFVLFVLALGILLVMAISELMAFSRMARIDAIRTDAASAHRDNDLARARKVIAQLGALYAHRPEVAAQLTSLSRAGTEVFDGDALLDMAETTLMTPLDRAALQEIEAAARQVATVTAFVPMALADVATALYSNVKLIRKLSVIYGGRSGSFGSIRLMRRVFSALLGAGAIALADDLIGSVTSGGILAKLSRRFGEGVVNGALTARVGIAAMELSRPLPFAALPKPGTSATTTRALAGLFGRAEAKPLESDG